MLYLFCFAHKLKVSATQCLFFKIYLIVCCRRK